MQRCQGAALVGRAHHWIWRVTTDDPSSVTSQQTDALRSLAKRATIRTVFDPPAGWARTWWRRSRRCMTRWRPRMKPVAEASVGKRLA